MSATKRESWGSLRKLPSGRWQARYPGPDGETYTARTEDDKSLTFLTKTDARRWLAAVHTKISLGQWEPPAVVAARNRADAEQAQARAMGFEEYSERWPQMIRTEPKSTSWIWSWLRWRLTCGMVGQSCGAANGDASTRRHGSAGHRRRRESRLYDRTQAHGSSRATHVRPGGARRRDGW